MFLIVHVMVCNEHTCFEARNIEMGAVPMKRPLAQPVESPADVCSHGCIPCIQKSICSMCVVCLTRSNFAWLQPTCIHDVEPDLVSTHCLYRNRGRRSTGTLLRSATGW